VEAAAIPVMQQRDAVMNHTDQLRKQTTGHRDSGSHCDNSRRDNGLLFGGHAAPRLDTPYHVTIKDNRDACHAISMMKVTQFVALSLWVFSVMCGCSVWCASVLSKGVGVTHILVLHLCSLYTLCISS